MSAVIEAAPAQPEAGHTTTRTILCVDDEPHILHALQRLLRPSGHRILTADNGHTALAHLD